MTTLTVDDERLTVAFPGWERLAAGRRAVSVLRSAIASAEASPGWTPEFLGRRTGLGVPGLRKLGTYRHRDGTRRLVSMSRGMPLLRVRLRDRDLGGGFDELIVSTPNAAELAAGLAGAPTPPRGPAGGAKP